MQRLLALRPKFRSPQQSEAILESIPDLDRTHGSHPSRGQLDPQGEPIEGLADLGHCGGALRVVQPEARTSGAGPLDEQLDGIGCDAALERQRRDRLQRLAGDPQVLARGGQDLGVPGATEDLSDGCASGTEHVFAVVHHQQETPAGHGLGHGVDQFDISLGCDAQCGRNGCRHRRRVIDWSELDQPHTVGKLICHLGADLDGEP